MWGKLRLDEELGT
jgi:hypothetical protein